MADVSAEPSMEEILSSIKRIIAEEEGVPARRRTLARPAAAPAQDDDDEAIRTAGGGADDGILELSQPLPAEEPVERPQAPAAAPDPAPAPDAPVTPAAVRSAPAPAEPPPPAAAEPAPVAPIVSPRAADATRGALDSLSRMVVRPSAPGGEETLEGLVRALLKPMLREWLDARLPELVETMVAREIARISGRDA